MTGSNIILDTNIVIELFKGNPDIIKQLGDLPLVKVPSIVLGELLLGAYRSSNPNKHLSQINGFLKKCELIGTNANTADAYALVKTDLLNKGKPIPENDIWIAAIAKQYNLTLVTSDAHFRQIEGLVIENW
ncbi:nucleic acid-binding protein [Parapedobacter pyrenivorans]|uniref:Nucleic acid-binding protein n=1 Tax=Parapedobacter pyrenivorans TaxID=1305674 RepID=A0A917MCE2_9SPHI|nr:type II toxin-antitoxin system VapC family toxin [Parapedobacter pyrenivorans]GGG91369.1 nucleic acid-binding protein [Parapedobacter pyrenivorans]